MYIYILDCLLYIKYSENKYITRNKIHSHETRGNCDLNPNFLRLKRTRDGTGYYGMKFYNVLPTHIRDLTCDCFKKAVKRFLLDNPFYSIGEFESFDFSTYDA